MMDIEEKLTLEAIELGQRMLGVWKFSLLIFGGDMKVDKFSWTTQDYYWNEGQCLLNLHISYRLNITLNGIKNPVEFISPK